MYGDQRKKKCTEAKKKNRDQIKKEIQKYCKYRARRKEETIGHLMNTFGKGSGWYMKTLMSNHQDPKHRTYVHISPLLQPRVIHYTPSLVSMSVSFGSAPDSIPAYYRHCTDIANEEVSLSTGIHNYGTLL